MTLPDCLTADDQGYIYASGHRIGLHHIIRLFIGGYSPEMIGRHYPTMPLALVHNIIAFYAENQSEMDAYLAAHDREMDRQIAAERPGPTLAELRARLEAI
jgi:uncharacterized protein (DUF433 family)